MRPISGHISDEEQPKKMYELPLYPGTNYGLIWLMGGVESPGIIRL